MDPNFFFFKFGLDHFVDLPIRDFAIIKKKKHKIELNPMIWGKTLNQT